MRRIALALVLVLLIAPAAHASAWAPVPTPTSDTLRNVSFLDTNIGLAVGTGHTILRTTDGGASWTQSMGGYFGFGWYDATWATPTTAVVVGANAVFQPFVGWSVDGGMNWQLDHFYIDNNEGTIRSVTTSGLNVVAAATLWDGRGVILVNNVLAPVLGTEWTKTLEVGGPLAAVAADGLTAVAVGWDGAVHVSETGGLAWTARPAPTGELLQDVDVDGTTILAVGTGGTAYVSEDAGLTWTRGATGTTRDLAGVALRGDGAAVAVGAAGTLLESTDNGRTWSGQTPTGANLLGVDAAGTPAGSKAWAVGAGGTVLLSG